MGAVASWRMSSKYAPTGGGGIWHHLGSLGRLTPTTGYKRDDSFILTDRKLHPKSVV